MIPLSMNRSFRHRDLATQSLSAGIRAAWCVCVAALCTISSGCFAPLSSPGVPATRLPDEFRFPYRTSGQPLNYSSLMAPPPAVYTLGSGDILELNVPDLITRGAQTALRLTVTDSGDIQIPRLGLVNVGGLSLAQAQTRVNEQLDVDILSKPQASLSLVEKGTINVVVLGAVNAPGTHSLPRFQNDIGHALAAAGGLSEDAGTEIQIHRRNALPHMPLAGSDKHRTATPGHSVVIRGQSPPASVPPLPNWGHGQVPATVPSPQGLPVDAAPAAPGYSLNPSPPTGPGGAAAYPATQHFGPETGNPAPGVGTPTLPGYAPAFEAAPQLTPTHPRHFAPLPEPAAGPRLVVNDMGQPAILTIPLTSSEPLALAPEQVILSANDVIMVPHRTDEVFYVVGKLSETNRVRFSVGDRDREIGNGFLLPRDREVDVVTAVAMAGYIDPIDSPTTVTLQRIQADGSPLLVTVDLFEARRNPRATLLVRPNDIIYLNPDWPWYTRRLIDQVINRALGTAIGRWLTE